MPLDVDFVRSCFPALRTEWALFDNAGGSIPAGPVIDRIANYMRQCPVQLGASHTLSAQAQERVRAGEAAAADFVGASTEETIVGPSTTVNLQMLARALAPTWSPGDEIIVTDLDHEANIGPWRALEQHGLIVKTWPLRPDAARLDPQDLGPLLGPRTRLVAFTHCANVVGEIADLGAVVGLVRASSPAMVCVDGVAFAPHRRVDVRKLDVDFYALSLYKVYGPHLGVLYGRREHLLRAAGQNHFFVANDQLPYKFQPGNVTHELAAGIEGIAAYFDAVAEHHGFAAPSLGERLDGVFELIAEHEATLTRRLLSFLVDHPRVRVIGPPDASPDLRVPTIAFVVEGQPSSEVVPRIDAAKVAVRFGHFYAKRAIDALDLGPCDGIVRVSMVHYNTLGEVDRLLACLEQVL